MTLRLAPTRFRPHAAARGAPARRALLGRLPAPAPHPRGVAEHSSALRRGALQVVANELNKWCEAGEGNRRGGRDERARAPPACRWMCSVTRRASGGRARPEGPKLCAAFRPPAGAPHLNARPERPPSLKS
jgi:hypothetical protein